APHEDGQPPVFEARPLGCQLAQSRPQRLLGRPPVAIADRGARRPGHPARPPLREVVPLLQVGHHLAPRGGRHRLFATTSFSAALSSVSSRSSCFSLRFSSSSCLRRRSWLTSSPPYFAFQRW